MKLKEMQNSVLFMFASILLFIVASIWRPDIVAPSFEFAMNIAIKIVPVLVLIFVLLFVFNKYVEPKLLAEYLGNNSGVKGWLIAIATGILSTGPIYLWYPLLNELQEKKVSNGLLAAFLYNRAVKPALIPLMVFYFGVKFVIVLTIVMIIFSVVQGMIVNKIVGVGQK